MYRLFTWLLAFTLLGLAPAYAQFGASRLVAEGRPFSFPPAPYGQKVVVNPSPKYNNVVSLHWKRGSGTKYVVLAGRYMQAAPYAGNFPTPAPNFTPAPFNRGNGMMDGTSRLPAYELTNAAAPYLIKSGDYALNAADTTALVLNATPGQTYYAYIWEYNDSPTGPQVLPAPPTANLSWQTFFSQFHSTPQITGLTLDANKRPTVTWTVATEDSVAGYRVTLAPDSITNHPLSGTLATSPITIRSTVTPQALAMTTTTYSQALATALSGPVWVQVTAFLTNGANYLPNDPLWSSAQLLVPPVPLPVELTYFTAKRSGTSRAQVQLDWKTASEKNNAGFQVQRSQDGRNWKDVSFVEGAGTTAAPSVYQVTELSPEATYYRLEQRDTDGKTTAYSPVRYVGAAGPTAAGVLQLFPNPATSVVHLTHYDPSQAVDVLNSLGQGVYQQANGQADLNLSALPRGLYLVRQGAQVRRLVLE